MFYVKNFKYLLEIHVGLHFSVKTAMIRFFSNHFVQMTTLYISELVLLVKKMSHPFCFEQSISISFTEALVMDTPDFDNYSLDLH